VLVKRQVWQRVKTLCFTGPCEGEEGGESYLCGPVENGAVTWVKGARDNHFTARAAQHKHTKHQALGVVLVALRATANENHLIAVFDLNAKHLAIRLNLRNGLMDLQTEKENKRYNAIPDGLQAGELPRCVCGARVGGGVFTFFMGSVERTPWVPYHVRHCLATSGYLAHTNTGMLGLYFATSAAERPAKDKTKHQMPSFVAHVAHTCLNFFLLLLKGDVNVPHAP
jgi:hypothetical protein